MLWSPLELTVHVRTYAFGERLIPEKLLKTGLPAEGAVAETWEISDHRDARATITRGPLAGQTLHEAIERYPDEIVGEGWRGPHFPLLAKFLDASHMLPVHLHASDEKARAVYQEPNGKTEAWHILWAEEGASILAGIKPEASRDDLIVAFKAQDYDAVMPRFPIRAGDTIYVPGGVLHSFGPGTLIYEVQQTSDIAENVMPADLYGNRLPEEEWDRNIERVLDQLETDYQPRPNPGLSRRVGESVITVGCACEHFALERWTVADPIQVAANPRRCVLVSNAGRRPITIRWTYGGLGLGQGASALLPAALGPWSAAPYLGSSTLIVSYVPDLEADIIAPLRAAGHSDEEIAALGHVFAPRGR